MESRDDASLIAQARAGDAVAFEQLIRPQAGRLYQTLYRISGNHADAADAYQDAVLAAFQKVGEFRGDSQFSTWLFRIAVNCALMQRRANKRAVLLSMDDGPHFNWMGGFAEPARSFAPSCEDAAQRAELRGQLSNALNELPDLERTIVWLKDVDGLNHAEIAAATELTVLAVRSRLHRARLRLRELLSKSLRRAIR